MYEQEGQSSRYEAARPDCMHAACNCTFFVRATIKKKKDAILNVAPFAVTSLILHIVLVHFSDEPLVNATRPSCAVTLHISVSSLRAVKSGRFQGGFVLRSGRSRKTKGNS